MAKAATSEKSLPAAALAREHETYQAHLQELLHQEGKFALVHGADVAGVFDTYKDALSAGYERFGLKSFLVKKIASVETPVVLR